MSEIQTAATEDDSFFSIERGKRLFSSKTMNKLFIRKRKMMKESVDAL